MKKRSAFHFQTVVIISMVFGVLTIAFLTFRTRLYIRLQASEENHLAERARAVSEIFYIKLDDQLTMLESQARYFRGIDLTDYNAMKTTIMSTKGIGDFKNIGVANTSGATINYNGTSSGNILLTDYFLDAMQGNHAISETIVYDEEGYEVLVLAVPIQRDDSTVGVIYGTFTKHTLDSILESIAFSDTSTNILFNHDGKILAKTTSNSLHGDAIVITDIIPGMDTPDDGSSQSYYFTENGQRYVAVMVPIGIHDWYYTSIMPETVITQQTTQIMLSVGLVIAAVLVQFLIVLLHINSLIRKSDKIADMNEQFRIINDQSHNIVFSYNYKTETMTIDGNTSHIIPLRKASYDHAETEEFLKLIHPEDTHISQAILAVRTSMQPGVQGELRLKNIDGNYYWYRMNATVFRDENGKPLRLLGSIFDVDEQRNKEIKLMEQAQTDSLTSLLNKGAFREQVQKALSQPDTMTALYIIDLDNFKAVNDNLGHAMGDKVLTDVANKLVELFGSRECVGRIGGDEFAAFLTGSDLTEEHIAERAAHICKRMQEIYTSFTAEVHVSVSTGVSLCPRDGTAYDVLYRKADVALYKVKGSGKNTYAIYHKEEFPDD